MLKVVSFRKSALTPVLTLLAAKTKGEIGIIIGLSPNQFMGKRLFLKIPNAEGFPILGEQHSG